MTEELNLPASDAPAASDAVSAEKKPTRKRTVRRKVAAPAEGEVSAAPASDASASEASAAPASKAPAASAAPAASSDAPAAPAPKRRGRPRKVVPAAEEGAAAPAAPAKAPAAKKAPAKAAAQADAPAATGEEAPAAPARRKRRTKAEMAAAAAEKEAKLAQKAEAKAASQAQAAQAAEKPAREVSAAVQASEAPKALAAPSAPAAPAAQEAAEEHVVRRRPGRSKTPIAVYVPEGEVPAAAVEEAPVEKPTRGRKPRARKVEAPEEAPELARSADENQAQETASDQAQETERQERSARRNARDSRESRENGDAREGRENREGHDYREGRTPRQRDQRDRRDREGRDNRDNRDNRDRQNAKGRFDRNDQRDRSDRDQRSDRFDNRGGQGAGRNQGNASSGDRRFTRRQAHGREPIVPKVNKEELAALKVAELREKAAELGIDGSGMKKAELVEKVYEAAVRAEGFIEVEGILDIMQDGYGFLRTKGYLPSETDVYVGLATIRRNGLRKGDMVKGQTRPSRENEKYAALQQVMAINGTPLEEVSSRVKFGDLTPIFPDECLTMEHGHNTITARVIDLVSPIGKGQRGLIVSPPKAGKTTVLKDIAAAISANNPEVHLMCLLVDERPEEVTDMQRSIKGEVIASTFDMPTENHIAVSELVIERAKRLVELGQDVVVLLDSLTRLARAYNLAQPASGRILSGGVDSTALYPPKKFLGAARNIEGGGSLTILASALVETGSKMDEVIFEEFKGTGNMELKLDRALADRRVFPAIDPISSGTRKEDLLLNPQEAPLIWAVRRILSNMNSTERAMDMLIKSLKQTDNNQEFLLRTAKKAQNQHDSGNEFTSL